MSKKYIITIIPIIIIIILGYVYFSAPEIDTEPIILSEKKEVLTADDHDGMMTMIKST